MRRVLVLLGALGPLLALSVPNAYADTYVARDGGCSVQSHWGLVSNNTDITIDQNLWRMTELFTQSYSLPGLTIPDQITITLRYNSTNTVYHTWSISYASNQWDWAPSSGPYVPQYTHYHLYAHWSTAGGYPAVSCTDDWLARNA